MLEGIMAAQILIPMDKTRKDFVRIGDRFLCLDVAGTGINAKVTATRVSSPRDPAVQVVIDQVVGEGNLADLAHGDVVVGVHQLFRF
jgi:hypothetical protein